MDLRCEEQLCVLLQVKTAHALANIEVIAAVDSDGILARGAEAPAARFRPLA
ncbi:hypothetical protein [Massilia sp. S19_KUP03_FR1]|uniref:hypothetical protein n=1 Tax=Massilia sp. S19_KUP03_FR1 TaxID=3025503 RepID=UPI002FCDDD6D